jgi:DNA-binding CsgD family transcriptional regulator
LKICELLRQGYSAESIAGCFGISAWTVYAIRQRVNASSK